jgi:catechol 2,3-dioxygenase-like lactoylglutathione lyase family enzyme
MIDIEQVDHIGIRVRDKTRALAFYEQLGFELVHESSFDASSSSRTRPASS